MATISSLKISGVDYDIYAKSATSALSATSGTSAATADKSNSAKSAGSASKLTAAKTITYQGDVTGSVSTDWSQDKSVTLTVVNSPWSSMAGVSASAVNTNTTGFVTPKAVYDYVQAQTGAALTNAYKHKGTTGASQLASLTPAIGDVYNISGAASTGTLINGQLVFNGDNMVATATQASNTSWDKLAATFDASDYVSKSTWDSSTGNWQNAYTTVNGNSASNWANTAHKAFDTVKAGTTTVKTAANSADTFTVSGTNGIAVTGANGTINVYPSAFNYGKVNIGGAVTQATTIGDTFGFVAGSNIDLTTGTKQVTISAKNTTYSQATTSTLGTNKASYVTGTTAVIF